VDGWHGLLGVVILPAAAWALGGFRRPVPWRLVVGGLALQVVIAAVLLKLPVARAVFLAINDAVHALQEATRAGTTFVFGYVGGGPLPFAESHPGASFILGFQALPLILVVSALSALLFHWRILPAVVQGCAWALRRSLGVGGAVGVSAAANVFVGMVEAPLLIRPYLARMDRGELFMVMTSGMATIAGTVLVVYAFILAPVLPEAPGQLLTASLISAPAALMIAALMVPTTGAGTAAERLAPPVESRGAIDAVARGTADGVTLLLQVAALLVVFVALVALANQLLAWLPEVAGAPLTLQRILGWLMAPAAWLIGVPWAEAPTAGALIGTKVVLNEFIAYVDLAALPPDALSDRARLIVTYALCGFANFGSLGILIGGMGAMAPERRGEIIALGPPSIVSGVLATGLTGAIVGLLV